MGKDSPGLKLEKHACAKESSQFIRWWVILFWKLSCFLCFLLDEEYSSVFTNHNPFLPQNRCHRWMSLHYLPLKTEKMSMLLHSKKKNEFDIINRKYYIFNFSIEFCFNLLLTQVFKFHLRSKYWQDNKSYSILCLAYIKIFKLVFYCLTLCILKITNYEELKKI